MRAVSAMAPAYRDEGAVGKGSREHGLNSIVPPIRLFTATAHRMIVARLHQAASLSRVHETGPFLRHWSGPRLAPCSTVNGAYNEKGYRTPARGRFARRLGCPGGSAGIHRTLDRGRRGLRHQRGRQLAG